MDEHDIATINSGLATTRNPNVKQVDFDKVKDIIESRTTGFIDETFKHGAKAITSGILDSGIEHAYDRAQAQKDKKPSYFSMNTLFNAVSQTSSSLGTSMLLDFLTEKEILGETAKKWGQPIGTGVTKVAVDAMRGKIKGGGDIFIRGVMSIGADSLAGMLINFVSK